MTLFTGDGAVPIHNNLAEQQMNRIALLRKNALFVGTPRGGDTAAILSSITSTCQRHGINPQVHLTQLLIGLADAPVSQLDQWLPDRWESAQASPHDCPPASSSSESRTRRLAWLHPLRPGAVWFVKRAPPDRRR
ncbi:MAG: transposase [Phycisphaerae bacterium]|nr:transposase [Phycisphaerae bacterium]